MDIEFYKKEIIKEIKKCEALEKERAHIGDYSGALEYKAKREAFLRAHIILTI